MTLILFFFREYRIFYCYFYSSHLHTLLPKCTILLYVHILEDWFWPLKTVCVQNVLKLKREWILFFCCCCHDRDRSESEKEEKHFLLSSHVVCKGHQEEGESSLIYNRRDVIIFFLFLWSISTHRIYYKTYFLFPMLYSIHASRQSSYYFYFHILGNF